MNEYIVVVNYWPMPMGKRKMIRIKSEKTSKEVYDIILKKEEEENPHYEVIPSVETVEEFLSKIQVLEV